MTEAPQRPGLHRILVALDGDESAQAALEAAADLAAALQAELVGLFVEDSELLLAADLPVTWTIPSHARAGVAVDAAIMRRALKISAGRAGAAVAAVAERLRLKWSFRVIQGGIVEQVLAEAQRCDLLALGSAGTLMRRARLEVAAGLLDMPAPCSLLMMHAQPRPGRPVAVLYDGSARALDLGRQLAAAYRRRLLVIAAGSSAEEAAERQAEAETWLREGDVGADLRSLVGDGQEEVCEALRGAYPAVLVVDRQGALGSGLSPDALLHHLACSVFVLK